MSTSTILIILGLLLALACFAYIFVGAQKLEARRNARVAAESPPPPVVAETPQVVPAEPTSSPFLAAPDGPPDDLSRIKGIGPKLSARLAELGVFHYRQIADWTPEQLAAVDRLLGAFQGRPARDQWQNQARLLASGDTRAYERAHGKLGPDAPGPLA
jgi:predicted flap endonuclease-1-like 5' DNA nuclease